jgi:parallel beta-helix repeat protein
MREATSRTSIFASSLVFLALTCMTSHAFADAITLGSVSTYGNFHAGGVIAAVSGDAGQVATATLQWRPTGQSTFQPGQPLARIDATHFAGSLFWLNPRASYDVQVTVSSPDGVTGAPSETATLQTRSDVMVEPTVQTLYVAPTGDDGNAGVTLTAPLKTIQHAANLAHAGTLILISPGEYHEGVTVPVSGTASQPIVFRGNGSGVVVDGSDPAILAGVPWTDEGNSVHSLVTGFTTLQVVTEAGRLFPYSALSDLQALANGPPGGSYFDGAKVYVKFADGSAPANHTMYVSRYDAGFSIDTQSNVRVEGLAIRFFGSAYGEGVYLKNSSDCAVRNSSLQDNGYAGVLLKGGDQNLVENNDIWATSVTGWPWNILTIGGVFISDDRGRGTVIRRNKVHGVNDGISWQDWSAWPLPGITTETDVYENTVESIIDDALEPRGSAANTRFWNNTIKDALTFLSCAPCFPGPTYAIDNVAYHLGNIRSTSIDGNPPLPLKMNSGNPQPSGPINLFNNTVIIESAASNALSFFPPGANTSATFRNNVLTGTRYVLEELQAYGLDWDYDDLYTTDSTRFVKWSDGTLYTNLTSLQASGHGEQHAISAPPQLVDPANGDFRPATGSPLIAKGVPLPGINDGYDGAAPNIGAYPSPFSSAPDGGAPAAPDSGTTDASIADGAPGNPDATSSGAATGCGCHAVSRAQDGKAGLILLALMVSLRRRRRRRALTTTNR